MARYTVVPTLEGPGAEEESPVRGADSPAAARLLLRVTARRTRLGTLYTCLWTRRTLAVLVCIGVAVAYIAVTLGTATPPVQLLVLGLPAAFTLAVANGANDIANSVGTSVGCGALTLNVALGLGSAVEFVGAVSMGASVTATISEGVVNGTKFEENPAQFSLLMLSVLMGAGASTLLATIYGLPISATHGIIAGLVAVGMVAEGPEAILFQKVAFTVVAWIASPIAGMLSAFLLYLFIRRKILLADDPVSASRAWEPVFVALTITTLLVFVLESGPAALRAHPAWLGAIIAPVCFGVVLLARRAQKQRCPHMDMTGPCREWYHRMARNAPLILNRVSYTKLRNPRPSAGDEASEGGGVFYSVDEEEDGGVSSSAAAAVDAEETDGIFYSNSGIGEEEEMEGLEAAGWVTDAGGATSADGMDDASSCAGGSGNQAEAAVVPPADTGGCRQDKGGYAGQQEAAARDTEMKSRSGAVQVTGTLSAPGEGEAPSLAAADTLESTSDVSEAEVQRADLVRQMVSEGAIGGVDGGVDGGVVQAWSAAIDGRSSATALLPIRTPSRAPSPYLEEPPLAEEEAPFVSLLVLSALTLAFAHGGNDVANSAAPLAVIFAYEQRPGAVAQDVTAAPAFWVVLLCGVGFVVGIAALGSRTISTVGSKLTTLTPSKSFATQVGAALAVLLSSAMGMPVSTSHCLVGAVVGCGFAEKLLPHGVSTPLHMSVLKKIVVGWVATIPMAMVVSLAVYWSLAWNF